MVPLVVPMVPSESPMVSTLREFGILPRVPESPERFSASNGTIGANVTIGGNVGTNGTIGCPIGTIGKHKVVNSKIINNTSNLFYNLIKFINLKFKTPYWIM